MIARHVDTATLKNAATTVGAVIYNQSKDPRRFVLRPAPGCHFRRTSASFFRQGRRVHAVCWHGHRDFFRAVFAQEPHAVFVTALARYDAPTFEDVFPKTAWIPYGPLIAGGFQHACEACDCPESGTAVPSRDEEATMTNPNPYFSTQSDEAKAEAEAVSAKRWADHWAAAEADAIVALAATG